MGLTTDPVADMMRAIHDLRQAAGQVRRTYGLADTSMLQQRLDDALWAGFCQSWIVVSWCSVAGRP